MCNGEDSLVREFEALRRRSPTAPLIRSPTRAFTVDDVAALARSIEARLGVRDRPQIVALQLPNGPGFLAGLLAALRTGAAVLLIDQQAPRSEAVGIAENIGAGAWMHGDIAWPRNCDAIRLESLPRPRPLPDALSAVRVIKVTSGSTGAPRGIGVTSAALLADADAIVTTMGIASGDRLMAAIPLSHSYGLASLAVPALARGLTLIVADGPQGSDPLDAAGACAATVFPTVPAYIAAHLGRTEPRPLPAELRLVVTAGAPLPPSLATRFRRQHDQPIHVFYGASECGGISYDRDGGSGERGTLGTPVDGVEIAPLPGGDRPEGARVVVRSPAVAAGYLPEARPNLREGRFETGDLAILDGGEIRLVGRLGDQINVRGLKVNPREVEAIIAELPGVTGVRVVGVARESSGDQVVRAVVACKPGSLSEDDVLATCLARLSGFKVPRSIRLVESIPTSARGKIERRTLDQDD